MSFKLLVTIVNCNRVNDLYKVKKKCNECSLVTRVNCQLFLPPRSGTHCWKFQFVGEGRKAHRETPKGSRRRPGVAAEAVAGRRRHSPSSRFRSPEDWCGSPPDEISDDEIGDDLARNGEE